MMDGMRKLSHAFFAKVVGNYEHPYIATIKMVTIKNITFLTVNRFKIFGTSNNLS
jgi:hypothetical protein